MNIRRVSISFTLPVPCHMCPTVAASEPRTIEVEDTSMDELAAMLERERIGHSFPVGWGGFHMDGRTVYRCRECTLKTCPELEGRI